MYANIKKTSELGFLAWSLQSGGLRLEEIQIFRLRVGLGIFTSGFVKPDSAYDKVYPHLTWEGNEVV